MEELIIEYQSIFGKSIIEFDLFDFFSWLPTLAEETKKMLIFFLDSA
jgi:hypothetical protein